MSCVNDIVLITEDRRLFELCREILDEQCPRNHTLVVAEPRLPLPEASLYIWDYRPGLELAWKMAAESPKSHVVLVERTELARSRELQADGVIVALKPITKAALCAWLGHALGNGPAERLRQDRDEILQALIETTLQLQVYDQDRTTFLARAIHDFRAPLTATSGYCGLLLDGQLGPLTDPQKEVLGRIQASVKRLARMTAAMFQLSVGPHVHRPPNLEEGDIREAIQQALHEIRPRATERRLHVEVNIAAPVQVMYFERDQLEQLVLNLLDNACKFAPKNGKIEVTGYPWFWERRSERVHATGTKERRLRACCGPECISRGRLEYGPGNRAGPAGPHFRGVRQLRHGRDFRKRTGTSHL